MGIRAKALALCVAGLLVAGCGGSSNNSSSNQTTKKKTTNVTNTATTRSSTSTQSSTSASSTPTFASTANCLQLSGLGEQFSKAMESAVSGGKYNLQEVVKGYQALVNASPSAIRPDMQTIASAFTNFADALSKSGWKEGSVPSATAIASIEAAGKDLDAAKIKTAADHIESWAVANCKA